MRNQEQRLINFIPSINDHWVRRLDPVIEGITHKSTIKFRSRCLKFLIGMIIYSNKEHQDRQGQFFVTKNFFSHYFGLKSKALDKIWGYIQHHPGLIFNTGINSKHPSAREASSYSLTDQFTSDLIEFYSSQPEVKETPNVSIYSVGSISGILSHVQVNTGAMKKLALERSDFRTLNAIKIAEANNGYMPNNYFQNPNNNRYYSVGASLQSIKKEYVPLAFRGMGVHCQVDANCTAQSILFQHPRFKGIDFENTKYYVANKKKVREQLSKEIGVDIELIKKGITAGTYGAPLRSGQFIKNGRLTKTSIYEIFGEATSLFIENEFVRGFFREQREALKRLDKTEKNVFLQKEEARIITEPLTRLGSAVVLKHDGVIFSEDIDTNYLTDRIEKETGFKIDFEKEFY